MAIKRQDAAIGTGSTVHLGEVSMVSTVEGQAGSGRWRGANTQRWRYQHYLAVLAIALIAYQAVGWSRWIASGPVQITKYRDHSSTAWPVAWSYESASVLTLLIVATLVIRKVIRERRFVIEAQFCVAGLACYWQDPMSNYVQPLFMNSSNWINLNEWTGNFPGVRNPDAGRMPEPILFGLPLYLAGFLVFALLLKWAMSRAKARFPGIGAPALLLIAALFGMVIDAALEVPIYRVGLWAYPGQPDVALFPHSSFRYPLTEALAGGLLFGVLAAMLYFRNERGETVMEQGLHRHSARRRIALSQLALIGVFNITYLTDNVWWNAWGLDSASYPPLAPSTVVGLCNTPGISGTNYGACPGSPGFRLPLPGDLGCPRPGGDPGALNGPRPCPAHRVTTVDPAVAHQ